MQLNPIVSKYRWAKREEENERLQKYLHVIDSYNH